VNVNTQIIVGDVDGQELPAALEEGYRSAVAGTDVIYSGCQCVHDVVEERLQNSKHFLIFEPFTALNPGLLAE